MTPAAGLAMLALLAGCGAGSPPARHDFGVDVHVASDDGGPLSSALVHRGSETLGKTDGEGRLALSLSGSEGQTVTLRVTCPEGYSEPKGALSLRLTRTRRVGASALEPQKLTAFCNKLSRRAVVVVRAPGGGELPVTVNGQPAGSTDADGNAHVLVEVHRNLRALDVALDTSGHRQLVPQNPKKLFELDGKDVVLLFEQPLSVAYRTKPVTTRAPAPRHVPTRID